MGNAAFISLTFLVCCSVIHYETLSFLRVSLGLGDIYPMGKIRMLTGIEALAGLVMIS